MESIQQSENSKLNQAETNAEQAKANYDSQVKLNKQAKAENETAQNNLDQAQKVKEQAEKMLKRL